MCMFNKVFCQHPFSANRIVMYVVNFLYHKSLRINCLCIKKIFVGVRSMTFKTFVGRNGANIKIITHQIRYSMTILYYY